MSEKQLQAERQQLILDILDEENAVQVEDLSKRLQVSNNTVRRDLNSLEDEGLLIRSKGGAVKIQSHFSPNSFEERLVLNRNGKKSIARKASEMIHDGETIILASGTSTLELAGYLKDRDHLTVITNSLEIAQVLSDEKKLTLILCGGIFDYQSRSMIGMPAELFFQDIHVDKLFMAVKALDEEAFYDLNMKETPVKRAMISTAEELIVLADSSKIGKRSLSRIDSINKVDTLLCDKMPSEEFLSSLSRANINIIDSSGE